MSIVCYSIILALIGTTQESERYNFALALTILNILSAVSDLVVLRYFTNPDTPEDVFARQRILIVSLYTVLFTVAVVVEEEKGFLFIPAVVVFLLSAVHRTISQPSVLEATTDVVISCVWIVFFVKLFG